MDNEKDILKELLKEELSEDELEKITGGYNIDTSDLSYLKGALQVLKRSLGWSWEVFYSKYRTRYTEEQWPTVKSMWDSV